MALTGKGGARRRGRVEALERPQYGWIWKPLLAALVLYLVVTLALGIWWSRTPAPLVPEQTVVQAREAGTLARGAVTTAGLTGLLETLLDKPGGYLRNDLAPPGLWLDNMPSWEFGVLSQARRLARALPTMSAGGGASATLDEIQERLQADSRDWFYPSTERRFEQALSGLDDYLVGFGENGHGGFAEGGQGLSPWLDSVAQALDELGLRLSASVGSQAELRDLDIDVATEALPAKTPWYRVDNVFFEARGQAWALLSLLKAVRHDQADVLVASGSAPRWDALIVELQRSQRRLWSPLVLNGSGFGLFANHSLVMANHMVRARDLTRSLATELAQPVAVEAPTPEASIGSEAASQARQPVPSPAAENGSEVQAQGAPAPAETIESPSQTNEPTPAAAAETDSDAAGDAAPAPVEAADADADVETETATEAAASDAPGETADAQQPSDTRVAPDAPAEP